MVQIATSFIASAAVVAIAPAFAAPVIESREPKLRSLVKIGGHVASGASSFQQREVEELEARKVTSAQAMSIARGAGKIASGAESGIELGAAVAPLVLPHKQRRFVEEDLLPRAFEFEELESIEAREPLKIGGIFKAVTKFIRETDGLDELD